MVHKKEEGTYHHIEKLKKEMPGLLSPGKGVPLLLIPEYSGISKDQRIPDRSKTAQRKPPAKCFLTQSKFFDFSHIEKYEKCESEKVFIIRTFFGPSIYQFEGHNSRKVTGNKIL